MVGVADVIIVYAYNDNVVYLYFAIFYEIVYSYKYSDFFMWKELTTSLSAASEDEVKIFDLILATSWFGVFLFVIILYAI